MKRAPLCLLLFLGSLTAMAQTGVIQDHCYQGGIKATTSGQQSANYLNGIIPACTVTVYQTGTTNKASITKPDGSPLSNPFTANAWPGVDPGGYIFSSATNQGVDIVMSGGNTNPNCNTAPLCYTSPVTRVDVFPSQSFQPVAGVLSINSVQGAFSFTGNVNCTGTSCNFFSGTTLQHNAINLPSQTLLNFLDSPASLNPPVIDAGFTPVVFKNDAFGGLAAETTASGSQFSAYLIPPTTGQFVNLCSGTQTGSGSDSNQTFTKASCGGAVTAIGGPIGAPHTATVTWSGYALPSYVVPGNVTAVYAVIMMRAESGGIGSYTFVCNSQTVGANSALTMTRQFNTLLTGINGSNIGTVSCTVTASHSGGAAGTFTYVNASMELFAFYTGTAPPAVNQVNVQPPLNWDPSINVLSLDIPPDLGTDSGTTNNYIVTMGATPLFLPGLTVNFIPGNSSTSTTPTLAVNGFSGTIENPRGGALVSGDLSSSAPATVKLGPDGNWWLQNPQASSAPLSNALTMNNSGSGASSGTTFDGSVARTLSYNTLGAAPTASPTFTGTVTMPAPTLNNVTGSTQCLTANSSGVVSGTGSACGSGSGSVSDGGGTTTANQIAVSTGSAHVIAYKDFPEHLVIPAANCNNATGGAGWSIPASNAPTVACRAGTNNLGGVLQWANNNTTTNAQFTIQLPFDWDTSVQPWINIIYGSGANTSGTVKWTFSSACTKSDGSVTDDPSFNAESATTGKTMAVANRMWAESTQFTAVTSGNNCIQGSTLIIKITSGNGTASSSVNVEQVTVTIPRQIVDQAN